MEGERQYKDIVEYVENEILYLKIENADEIYRKVEKLEKMVEFSRNAIKNLKNGIGMSITLVKQMYKKDIPSMENAYIDLEKTLPLSREELIKYVREKVKREKIEMLRRLKETLEKKKEEAVAEESNE